MDDPIDLLWGADEIAEFLFGDPTQRRRIYHLAETSRLPFVRCGTKICIRRSKLIEYIESQERKALEDGNKAAAD